VRLALAPPDAVAAATDKARTLAAAARVGVRSPRGVPVAEPDRAGDAIDEVGLPAVVKPLRSWLQDEGRGGVVRAALVTRRNEGVGAVKGLLDAGAEVAVQEWLPGDREAVSFIYADGRFWARFAQRADRMIPVLGGNSILRKSIPLPPDITAAGERLVEELGMEGYSEVEFRRDATGQAALMEINPRLSASVEIAVRAGIPFPRILYEWASGGTLREYGSYRTGRRMRYLGGDIGWLRHALTERGNPELPRPGRAAGVFIGDFLRPSGYDYLGWRDPRPAARATAHFVAEHVRRRTRAG
jgi:carbamoylphosphate synthase large subunit